MKRGKRYDPVLDRDNKIEEMRQLWERMSEDTRKEDVRRRHSGETLTENASAYFEWEKSRKSVESRN